MSSPGPPFTSAWASIPLCWHALQQISVCLPAPALREIPRIRKEAEHHYRVSSSFCSTKYNGMKKGWRANSPGNTPLIEEWFLLLQQLNKSQRLQVVCVSGIAPIDQKKGKCIIPWIHVHAKPTFSALIKQSLNLKQTLVCAPCTLYISYSFSLLNCLGLQCPAGLWHLQYESDSSSDPTALWPVCEEGGDCTSAAGQCSSILTGENCASDPKCILILNRQWP